MLPVCHRKYFPRNSPDKANFCLTVLTERKILKCCFCQVISDLEWKMWPQAPELWVIRSQLWCQRCMWQPLSLQRHQQWVWSQSPDHVSECLLHVRTSVTASNSSCVSGSSLTSSMILILQDVQSYKRRTSTWTCLCESMKKGGTWMKYSQAWATLSEWTEVSHKILTRLPP